MCGTADGAKCSPGHRTTTKIMQCSLLPASPGHLLLPRRSVTHKCDIWDILPAGKMRPERWALYQPSEDSSPSLFRAAQMRQEPRLRSPAGTGLWPCLGPSTSQHPALGPVSWAPASAENQPTSHQCLRSPSQAPSSLHRDRHLVWCWRRHVGRQATRPGAVAAADC